MFHWTFLLFKTQVPGRKQKKEMYLLLERIKERVPSSFLCSECSDTFTIYFENWIWIVFFFFRRTVDKQKDLAALRLTIPKCL